MGKNTADTHPTTGTCAGSELERSRMEGTEANAAAVEGAQSRLRPILMTSLAMMAGMLPMALGLGEGGEQTAPLGRAVIGGLFAATLATLAVLPSIFTIVQGRSHRRSASVDPHDPHSASFIRPQDQQEKTNHQNETPTK